MGTLATEVQRSRRLRRPFSVLLADVDHFKQSRLRWVAVAEIPLSYNDTHGHPAVRGTGDTLPPRPASLTNSSWEEGTKSTEQRLSVLSPLRVMFGHTHASLRDPLAVRVVPAKHRAGDPARHPDDPRQPRAHAGAGGRAGEPAGPALLVRGRAG